MPGACLLCQPENRDGNPNGIPAISHSLFHVDAGVPNPGADNADNSADKLLDSGTLPMTTHTLDAKDLTCPLPVLRARKAIKHLAPGDILEVAATDPAAVRDFPAFCEATGNELISAAQAGAVYTFRIRKAG
jgi:tRNA 2-thiouridine synthesizing protein A